MRDPIRHRLTAGALALCLATAGTAAQTTSQTPLPTPAAPSSRAVPLAEVLAIARRNPALLLTVRLQLARAGLKVTDVTCTAAALGGDWSALSGQTVAPYACPIGRRSLHLTATLGFTDSAGKRVAGSDPDLKQRATKIGQSRFKWSWRQR